MHCLEYLINYKNYKLCLPMYLYIHVSLLSIYVKRHIPGLWRAALRWAFYLLHTCLMMINMNLRVKIHHFINIIQHRLNNFLKKQNIGLL